MVQQLKPFEYVAIAAAVVAVIALIIGAVVIAKPAVTNAVPIPITPQAALTRSALVDGNNGTVTCSTYCNNVGAYNLQAQVPTMPSWSGATSYTTNTVANGAGSVNYVGNSGVCLCVEDPSVPLNTLPIPKL